jgi:predicted RNA binding protein YcfA (HicA-like mRNA interferase family)
LKVEREGIEGFLSSHGWKRSENPKKGSHISWKKDGALRPAVVDMNYADIPEEHIRSILKAMGKSRADLRKFLGQ